MPDSTVHPALEYCKKRWPDLEWTSDSKGEYHLFCAEMPLGLMIRLDIMGDQGSMAEFRTGDRWVGGCIFFRSENKQGVSWGQAIDEVMNAVSKLAVALLPRSMPDEDSSEVSEDA